MKLKITNDVEVKKSRLLIKGKAFPNYQILDKIGKGANGVILLARNEILGRDEAIKVWLPKDGDNRNKNEQASYELKKLAKAYGEYTIQLYSAINFENYTIATMEYFPGQNLDKFTQHKSIRQVFISLYMYLDAIEKTSLPETFHGDAHPRNVLLKVTEENYEKKLVLKLCDFGTSYFAGKEYSFDRHWRIVGQTIFDLTKTYKYYNEAKLLMPDYDNILKEINNSSRNSIINEDHSSFYDARTFTAPFRDYLEYIYFKNTGKNIRFE